MNNNIEKEKNKLINKNVKVTVVFSLCPHYKSGDKIFFKGGIFDKEKSSELCMVAINAIYPFIYAARRGGSLKEAVVQCPDKNVEFIIEIDE